MHSFHLTQTNSNTLLCQTQQRIDKRKATENLNSNPNSDKQNQPKSFKTPLNTSISPSPLLLPSQSKPPKPVINHNQNPNPSSSNPSMDFFKSVFSDDPEPSDHDTNQNPQPLSPNTSPPIEEREPEEDLADQSTSAWSFGGLIKTLTSKSESVFQTYRQDLEEFSSGLKKETEAMREAASRAVKDLPGTLDIGASVATEKLEAVGQAIDDLGTTVSGIIVHGKEALLSSDHESDSSDRDQFSNYSNQSLNLGKYYSRFDSQVRGIQADLSTYCEDPEDMEEFRKWKLGFLLGEKEEEIGNLVGENGVVQEIYRKLVPNVVDEETFWGRYFYRIYKLKLVEDARANLVRKAMISGEEEEELSWDIDDEEEGKNGVVENKELEKSGVTGVGSSRGGGSEDVVEAKEKSSDVDEKRGGEESVSEGRVDGCNVIEKVESSSKDSDFSVISSQAGEEEDLGWDEIEDLSNIDEKKVTISDSPNKADLRKRLSAADEEEDLSWDIEDDDGPVKH